MCRSWLHGSCPRAYDCPYIHPAPLPAPIENGTIAFSLTRATANEYCRNYLRNICPKKSDCQYIHVLLKPCAGPIVASKLSLLILRGLL
ncbi:hypothetical protein DL96DRAFT_1021903 [Flagelloscypha sp. PMI_526]|nr:hypothetical protein DL96DRAFT_1021903 [Flagelloscypha sp. PMI_526]